jgi:hypothetical protein
MAVNRVGGAIELKIGGVMRDAKGSFTYNKGAVKREAILGPTGVVGYKEMAQVPFLEGAITDKGNLDLDDIVGVTDETITLTLGNGKVFVLRNAWYAGDGNVTTEEGEIEVRFEGKGADEVS